MEIFLQHIKGREKHRNSNKEQENKNGKLVDEVFCSSQHTLVSQQEHFIHHAMTTLKTLRK
jgi:hypothetical protein